MQRIPSIFVSHGAPNILLNKSHPTVQYWTKFGKELKEKYNPKAILVISAHYEEEVFTLTTNPSPPVIYDFGGFEPEMYQQKYPASTSPALISRVKELLNAANLPFKEDPNRGFDHGCWSPLKVMFPSADIPVVELSLLSSLSPSKHIAVGKALQSLRSEGYLVIGSGSATHNLRELDWSSHEKKEVSWAADFDRWLSNAIHLENDEERLRTLEGFESHPSVRKAHPRTEHYIPLLVAAAAGGKGEQLHDRWEMGTLSMAMYAFS